MEVLADALEMTTVPGSRPASSSTSSIMNDVKNSGYSTIWCGSRSAS